LPDIENDGIWKFMGILSKNRWEWTATELASVRQSGTTVAFYDTLGPNSIEFIIK
jgi:long-subunit acyl-CoA synthetase (AMP-forming)